MPIIFLTYQCQVWQLAQTLAFVQYSLPLVVDGVRTVAGLAAQLDVAALLEFAVQPAPRLGGFHCDRKHVQQVIVCFFVTLAHIHL